RGVRPSAELDVGSGWQAAAEIFGAKRAGRGDQGAGVLHLVPGVPEKDSADAAGGEVIDDTLAERRLPVGEGFAARVELADRLVAQLEEVRVKEGQVAVGSPVSCHRAARGPAHGQSVVLVLDADPLAPGRPPEARPPARRG